MTDLNGVQLKTTDFNISNPNVSIKNRINNNKPGMLLIYADWCIHCQRFKPVFNKIHSRIGSSFVCASISDDELKNDSKLTESLNVRGYPTIKFFDQDGVITKDYSGKRDSSEILDSICDFYHICYKS